jgi:hypothetical protein
MAIFNSKLLVYQRVIIIWPVIQEIFDLENLILHGAAADGPLSQLL